MTVWLNYKNNVFLVLFDIGIGTDYIDLLFVFNNVFAKSNLDQPCWNTLWGPWVVCWLTSRTIRDINPIKNGFLENRICLFHFLGGTNHIIFQQQQKPQAWLINGLNNMFLSNKINNINNIKTITQEWIYINGLNNMFLFDNIGI